MQDQFGFENKENSRPPEENWIAFDPAEAERQRREESKRRLRFAASRIGWATALLVAVWLGAVLFATTVAELFGESGIAIYNKYLLIINEVTLAIGIAVAVTVLFPVPRVNIRKEKITALQFMMALSICFGVAYVTNAIGSVALMIWNMITGNSVGGELATLLYDMDPVLMFVSVGVLAPILEELFFRKLLTDRLRVFGELPAILLPAFFFALFHMSASQFLYAFTVGVILGYFYCRTGSYLLTVLIHAIFNTVSGVISILLLDPINGFMEEFARIASETMDGAEILARVMELMPEYGLPLFLYAIYSLFVGTLSLLGIFLLFIGLAKGKFKTRYGEYCLPRKEAAKTVFKTSGVIACTVFLAVMTFMSLFS